MTVKKYITAQTQQLFTYSTSGRVCILYTTKDYHYANRYNYKTDKMDLSCRMVKNLVVFSDGTNYL